QFPVLELQLLPQPLPHKAGGLNIVNGQAVDEQCLAQPVQRESIGIPLVVHHALKGGFPIYPQMLTYRQSQGNVFWEIKLWLGSIWLDLDRLTAEGCGLVQQTGKLTGFSGEQHSLFGNSVGK